MSHYLFSRHAPIALFVNQASAIMQGTVLYDQSSLSISLAANVAFCAPSVPTALGTSESIDGLRVFRWCAPGICSYPRFRDAVMLAELVGILPVHERGAFPDAEWIGKPGECAVVCEMYWISLTHPRAERYARECTDWTRTANYGVDKLQGGSRCPNIDWIYGVRVRAHDQNECRVILIVR
jgi:hypothetical protein